jgi:hypothetical protein
VGRADFGNDRDTFFSCCVMRQRQRERGGEKEIGIGIRPTGSVWSHMFLKDFIAIQTGSNDSYWDEAGKRRRRRRLKKRGYMMKIFPSPSGEEYEQAKSPVNCCIFLLLREVFSPAPPHIACAERDCRRGGSSSLLMVQFPFLLTYSPTHPLIRRVFRFVSQERKNEKKRKQVVLLQSYKFLDWPPQKKNYTSLSLSATTFLPSSFLFVF